MVRTLYCYKKTDLFNDKSTFTMSTRLFLNEDSEDSESPPL